MQKLFRRSLGLVTAAGLAIAAAGVVAPGAAFAGSSPPWGSDASAVGSLAFYNALGQQITGGSITDSPFAAFVEGTATIRANDTKATLFAYTPKSGQSPGEWSGEQLSSSTIFPNATAPGALGSATLPVVSGSSNDTTLATYTSTDFPNTDSSNDGYAGLYVLRLRTSAPGKSVTSSYDEAVIQVTGSTWAQVDQATISPAPTPTISGNPISGATLTAVPGTWQSGVALSYQWLSNGSPIGGATSSTLSVLASYVGSSIEVKVTGSLAGYANVTKTSAPVTIVKVQTLTPTPTISGTAETGKTLTAVPGTWTSGDSLTYQWLRDGSPISGAIASTYKLTSADFGHAISVAVTGAKAHFETATKTSASVTVTVGVLGNTPIPTVTGTAATGQILTAQAGTWKAGVVLSYQWLRAGQPIAGATSSTYTLVAADVGLVIRVRVTGSLTGYSLASVTSKPVTPVLGTLSPTPKPTISGNSIFGQTLTATPGTWQAGANLSYQWLRAGQPIAGATSSTYTLMAADVGQVIRVRVTGSLTGYTSVAETSGPKTPVAATLTLTPTPTITGSAVEGSTLTAVPGTWDAGVMLVYHWLRNGVVITGATSSTYQTVAADVGTSITVKVTGKQAGYTSVAKTSAAVVVAS